MPTKGTYAKGSARREEILATALQVIAEKGYHGTTLRGIGRELGVEPAHILYYFASREDLLREVIERWDAVSLTEPEPDADALEAFAAAIRRNLSIRGIVHLYLAFAAEAIDVEHPAHAFFRDRFTSVVEELAATIAFGQEAGSIRPELDPDRTARQLVALADGLQLQALMDSTADAPTDLEATLDSLFVGGRRVRLARPYQLRPTPTDPTTPTSTSTEGPS
ncbi:TetR/AcrR family transcriptional regulator [Microbacterium sp. SS28]|uniref:TetR/AcrR family transcriptional regulator n=1 Tax=Microbacterium sp. SS28 TaxID=2919948 RepID=UPI001FAA3839|nr:TetR/AcrR family transcriptional regulator [Microbacterium sp. SS28]